MNLILPIILIVNNGHTNMVYKVFDDNKTVSSIQVLKSPDDTDYPETFPIMKTVISWFLNLQECSLI